MTLRKKEVFKINGGEIMKEATLQKKIEQVNEVLEKFNQSSSAVFVNYLGLSVAQVTDLRRQLYDQGCEMKVIKNNLLRRAAEQAGYVGLDDTLVGPSAVAFSKDATTASKIMYEFAKKNKRLVIKGGVVEGKVIKLEDLKVLATLPNKEGMLSMLLSVLQAPIRNLALAIKAVAEKEV